MEEGKSRIFKKFNIYQLLMKKKKKKHKYLYTAEPHLLNF